MGKEDCGETSYEELHNRPLYYWLKSFAGRELDQDAPFPEFVSSNALTYALEYIGITSENEQSSLHLSAIFDEDSQQSKNKYPTHYESETKSRIQYLNRVFLELKSHFEDHYSQIVTIRPPNSVHISSACGNCSIKEFEKLLFLILGAAIHGTQKQDTIRKIKRFPGKIQESLIECVKLIAENLEVINIKSWPEFQSLSEDEQRKIYDNLLSLIRKMIMERNEIIQNQLLVDYFAGYMNCDQKRMFDTRGNTSAVADGEKCSEDIRLNNSMRHLREQLHEKSELLQECRVELEVAKNRIQELERDMNEFQQRHRLMRKARDELDALREGQEKASRLEAELQRMKAKLEETEHIYERVETLEIENRNLQIKHDMLLDQISFLSFEKTNRSTGFDYFSDHTGFMDGLSLGHRMKDDEGKFFDTDEEEPSVKENESVSKSLKEENDELEEYEDEEDDGGNQLEDDNVIPDEPLNLSSSTIQQETSPEKDEVIERPASLEISNTESVDCSGSNLVASTPKPVVEFKSQEVQTPTHPSSRPKRQRRRSSLFSVKKTRRTIIIPLPGSQKVPLTEIDKLAGKSPPKNSSQTIQLFKIYNVEKRKGSTRPRKFKSPTKAPIPEPDQSVPNVDNEGNEADEELSLSPTGNRNESDVDSINNDKTEGTDNDSEIYFVCSPPNSTGTTTPRKSHYGTTTAFPVSNDPRYPLDQNHVNFDIDSQETTSHHSNHLTVFNRNRAPSPPTTVHIPLMKISHEVQIGPSDTDEGLHDEDASNDFSYGDYNIQLNLRNGSIKPALINKITTLSANISPDHNSNNQYHQPHHHHSINKHTNNYVVETSSEEDGSVWYEYGCV